MPVPIEYIGGKSAGIVGGTTATVVPLSSGLTGGLDVAVTAGDLVIVTISVGTAARAPAIAIATPAGYTALTAQRTTASTADANVQTCYKFMPATPDASVTIPASGNAADGLAYAIQVFYGVDPTTPMDVAPTYATGSGVNNRPIPADISPVTPGATIVVCGGGAAATGTTLYTSADFDAFRSANGADTTDGTVGVGHIAVIDSGVYSFVAFGGGNVNAANSWGCTTLALRPMVGDIFDDAMEVGAGSDTSDAVIVPISIMEESLGGALTAGYWAGGWTTGALNVLTKFNYGAESIATLAAVLSPGRWGMTSFSSLTNGYLCGDNTNANSSNVTLLSFANESLTNDGFVNYYNQRTAGWSSYDYGYMAGGYSSYYGYTTHIQRRSLTTSTSSLLSAVIAGARSGPAGVQSTSKGYAAGGYSGTAPVNTLSGMVLDTETAFTPAANLTTIRQTPIGINGLTKGYVQGGWDNFSMLATTDTINHATDAVASAGFTMSTSRNEGSSISSPVKGYAAGGWDGFGASNQIDGITFANDAGINPAAALPFACEYPTGVYKNVSFAGARDISTGLISPMVYASGGDDPLWGRTVILERMSSAAFNNTGPAKTPAPQGGGATPPTFAGGGWYYLEGGFQWVFNGTNGLGYSSLNLAADLAEPALTAEIFVRATGVTEAPVFYIDTSETIAHGWQSRKIAIDIIGGFYRLRGQTVGAGATTEVTGSTAITAGVWHHVALVLSDLTFKLYINGVFEVAFGPCAYAAVPQWLFLGYSSYSGPAFVGYMAGLRLTYAARYFDTFAPPAYIFPSGQGGAASALSTADATSNLGDQLEPTTANTAMDAISVAVTQEPGTAGAIISATGELVADASAPLTAADGASAGSEGDCSEPAAAGSDAAASGALTAAVDSPAPAVEALQLQYVASASRAEAGAASAVHSVAFDAQGAIPPDAQGDVLWGDVLALLRGDKARDPYIVAGVRYVLSTAEYRYSPSSIYLSGQVSSYFYLDEFLVGRFIPTALSGSFFWVQRYAFGKPVLAEYGGQYGDWGDTTWLDVTGTSDLCVELWAYLYPGQTEGGLFDAFGYTLGVFQGKLQLMRGYPQYGFGPDAYAKSAAVVTAGAWHHYAMTRSGGVLTVYFDGTPVIAATDLHNGAPQYANVSDIMFGQASVDTGDPGLLPENWWSYMVVSTYWKGYLADIRVTANVRYTGAFTAPTVEHPNWLRTLDTRDVVLEVAGTGNADVYAIASAGDDAASSALLFADKAEPGVGVVTVTASNHLYLDRVESLVGASLGGADRISPVFSDEQTFAYAFPDGHIHLFFSVSEVSVAGAVVRIAETIEGSAVEAAAAVERLLISALGPRLTSETLHQVVQQVIAEAAVRGTAHIEMQVKSAGAEEAALYLSPQTLTVTDR